MNFKAYCDGSCAHKSDTNWMGMGIHLLNLDDLTIEDCAVTGPRGDHNIAEYLAIISTLEIVLMKEKVSSLEIYSDSQLVIRQITGQYQVKKKHLQACIDTIDDLCLLIEHKHECEPVFGWVPREHPEQKIADYLSNVANPHYDNIKRSIRPVHIGRVLHTKRFDRLHRRLKWGPVPSLPEVTDLP